MIGNAVVWDFQRYCIDFPCETLLLLLKSFASTSVLGCADSGRCRGVGDHDRRLHPTDLPFFSQTHLGLNKPLAYCVIQILTNFTAHLKVPRSAKRRRHLCFPYNRDQWHTKTIWVRRKHDIRIARSDSMHCTGCTTIDGIFVSALIMPAPHLSTAAGFSTSRTFRPIPTIVNTQNVFLEASYTTGRDSLLITRVKVMCSQFKATFYGGEVEPIILPILRCN